MKRVYWFYEQFKQNISRIYYGDVEGETEKEYYLCGDEIKRDFKENIEKRDVFESKKNCLKYYKRTINRIKVKLNQKIEDAEDILLD